MEEFALTEDAIKEGLEESDRRVGQAEKALKAAHEDREFWYQAQRVFEAAKARAAGHPVPGAKPGESRTYQRGLYRTSAGYLLMHLIHDDRGINYEDLVNEMLETEWASETKDPLGAIERAMHKLIDSEYVFQDIEGYHPTAAGLVAAGIIESDAPAEAEASNPASEGR